MWDWLHAMRNTDLLNLCRRGRGFLFHRWVLLPSDGSWNASSTCGRSRCVVFVIARLLHLWEEYVVCMLFMCYIVVACCFICWCLYLREESRTLLGWHCLSNAACLRWPHLFYACFVVSRITTIICIHTLNIPTYLVIRHMHTLYIHTL